MTAAVALARSERERRKTVGYTEAQEELDVIIPGMRIKGGV